MDKLVNFNTDCFSDCPALANLADEVGKTIEFQTLAEGLRSQNQDGISQIVNNKEFERMAQLLGEAMINSDQIVSTITKFTNNPQHKRQMQEKLLVLKQDNTMKNVLRDIEENGHFNMMKYWQNSEVVCKLGKLFGQGGQDKQQTINQLHAAASQGDLEQLKQILLSDSIDTECKDEQGRTALHFAAGYGQLECLKTLISCNANLEQVDNNGNTALHYAAGYGQKFAALLLLEKASNTNAKNKDSKTPYQVAQLNKQTDIIEILKPQ